MSTTTYQITYLDKYQQSHTTEIPADNPEAAIEFLEENLNEQIEVTKIYILDEEEQS